MNDREHIVAYLFILPACALIFAFVLWPGMSMARDSVHRQLVTGREAGAYCGVENFADVWADARFRQAARNTAYFALLVVPIQTAIALLLAVWTSGPGWSRRVLRWSVFAPTAVSLAVLSVLWKLLYEPAGAAGGGLLNGLLAGAGAATQPFLTSAAQALYCIAAMSVWQGVGFQMMIFLAGLQTVPAHLQEAAELDGARPVRRFMSITLPLLAPTIVLVVMITTIFALKLFVQPYVMTGGGPRGSTMSIVQYIYQAAFLGRDLGLASAAAVIFFAVVGAIACFQWRASRWSERMA